MTITLPVSGKREEKKTREIGVHENNSVGVFYIVAPQTQLHRTP